MVVEVVGREREGGREAATMASYTIEGLQPGGLQGDGGCD